MALLRGESDLWGLCGVPSGSFRPGEAPCHLGGLPKRVWGSVSPAGPAALPEGAARGAGGAARAGSLSLPRWVVGLAKKKGKMAFLSPFLSAEGVVGLWVLVVLWVLLGFVVVSSVFLLAVLSILCQRG